MAARTKVITSAEPIQRSGRRFYTSMLVERRENAVGTAVHIRLRHERNRAGRNLQPSTCRRHASRASLVTGLAARPAGGFAKAGAGESVAGFNLTPSTRSRRRDSGRLIGDTRLVSPRRDARRFCAQQVPFTPGRCAEPGGDSDGGASRATAGEKMPSAH